MFKGKLFQTQVNKKRTNREAGRGKDKSSGSVQFLCQDVIILLYVGRTMGHGGTTQINPATYLCVQRGCCSKAHSAANNARLGCEGKAFAGAQLRWGGTCKSEGCEAHGAGTGPQRWERERRGSRGWRESDSRALNLCAADEAFSPEYNHR